MFNLNVATLEVPEQAPIPTLALKNVSIYYDKIAAIEGANLSISRGEITALVGPSGCGKSSILSSINRMTDSIDHCTVSGSIQFVGEEILDARTSVTDLRRRIGMVFQQPNPFPLSIVENIRFPLRDHGLKNEHEIQRIVQDVLTKVGLWEEVKDRLKSNALKLSGGQQQRLCIARCLALKPELILLDEPCSALDPIAAATVEQLISELKQEYTVLMVTHNLAQARRIADQVAVCWMESGAGCIVDAGDADHIFQNSAHPITRAFCEGRKG